MTTDERKYLTELANELSYLAIRYADLSPSLTGVEWDGLAEEMAGSVVRLMERRIDDERARIEQEKEVARSE